MAKAAAIPDDRTNEALAAIGVQCGEFALRCSDAAGFIAQVNGRIATDKADAQALSRSVSDLSVLQAEANGVAAEIGDVAARATLLIGEGHKSAQGALTEMEALVERALATAGRLESLVAAIEQVSGVSEQLDSIARQTRMLAINATIEAARAGDAASGFGAVAAEVKRLAANATAATATVADRLHGLERSTQEMIADIRSSAEQGRRARASAGGINDALTTMGALVVQFDQGAAAIGRCGDQITRHVETLDSGLSAFAGSAAANAEALDEATRRIDALEGTANGMLDDVAHTALAPLDSRFVALAIDQAAQVADTIDLALSGGTIDLPSLFDEHYRVVAGGDPAAPQYLNAFVPFADTQIRPMLDRFTGVDPAIVGCVMIDRKGFLPTHISERSQPVNPADREWSLQHARNRRIFVDRQTSVALECKRDWCLYTYRQDFGDGRYRPLRSVFVPLSFGGRRWGVFELGYIT